MRYVNTNIPKFARKDIEGVVSNLVDLAEIRPYSTCAYNCEDHIAIACKPFVEIALYPFLFSDSALANRKMLDFLQTKGSLEQLYGHASQWLAKALRAKYPPSTGE